MVVFEISNVDPPNRGMGNSSVAKAFEEKSINIDIENMEMSKNIPYIVKVKHFKN